MAIRRSLFLLLLPGVAVLLLFLSTREVADAQSSPPAMTTEEGHVLLREHSSIPARNPLRRVPDEFLVRFKRSASRAAVSRLLAALPSQSVREYASIPRLHHVELAPGTGLTQAFEALGRSAEVEYIEPNYLLEIAGVPDDPSFGSQWPLQNLGQTGGLVGADIGAVAAWDQTTGSGDTVVAVLDTGIDYTHLDLAANMYRNDADCDSDGVDGDDNGFIDDCHGIDTVNLDTDPSDDNGHGTHVAGTIGAVGANATGISGVSWNVGLMACKMLDANGTGDTASAIACLDYVAQTKDRGVDVVATNSSWSGGLYSRPLVEAIEAMLTRGILFVAAAGNTGSDNDIARTYPCAYELPNVICVAATDANDLRPSFSSYGRTTVHLGAPGVAVLSTVPGSGYDLADGTSMATPHVSGVVALLHAQDPDRDWRALKNLTLAGGAPTASLAGTISQRRLSALGSLTCSGSTVVARLRPSTDFAVGTGVGVPLSALNVECDLPAGALSVAVFPGSIDVPLLDNGLDPDRVADDGIYAGIWMPAAAGDYTLTFPDGSTVSASVTPDLKPGFPRKTYSGPGSYHAGQALHTLVGNVDADPQLEILATGLAQGPLYAWNNDGTPVAGWPGPDLGAAYPVLVELSFEAPGFEVFAGHYGADPDLIARTGAGLPLLGWPRASANYVATPPSAADVVGGSLDELFTEEEDWRLHGYAADGQPLPGWPEGEWPHVGGQERHTPAIADLDGDGDLELVTASGSGSTGVHLLAHHHDGSLVDGFPVAFSGGGVDTFPAVGDVDGDGQYEIVIAGKTAVHVFAVDGSLERSMVPSGSVFYSTAPALADLDTDGTPEIVVQTNQAVNVWKGDGSALPGWPFALGSNVWVNNAGPVVGDVDGDGEPEVLALALRGGLAGAPGDLLVFGPDGTLERQRTIPGLDDGAVPAIADLDLDGRNDVIVTSSFWNGVAGYYDKVWAFDFGGPTPHGSIEWGQFMSHGSHHGRYEPRLPARSLELLVTRTGSGSGSVLSDPVGIDCGTDCSELLFADSPVELSAIADAGSLFASWAGACTGQGNPCTVTIAGHTSVSAEFVALHSVTVGTTGSGSVTSSPSGIDCGLDCEHEYASGTVLELTAIPAAPSGFAGWGGACLGQGNPCTVTVSANLNVTAEFQQSGP
jgi:hypothetical protein